MTGPKINTETVHLAIEQSPNSWALIAFDTESGSKGVAAFGPNESLPLMLGIFERAGAMPKKTDKPSLVVVKE